MDDMERYELTPGTEAAEIKRRANETGVEAHALRFKAGPDGERRTHITFFGPPSPRRVREFTIRGVSFGEEVELTWRDGEISGHEERKRLLEEKAKGLEGFPVGRGPGGWPVSESNHLDNPYAAYTLMRWGIFQEVLAETGEIPEAPKLPPGTIP